jgi:hypothetical protein
MLRILSGEDGLLDCTGRAEKPKMITGWVLMDFYNDPKNELAPLIIEFNYRQHKLYGKYQHIED